MQGGVLRALRLCAKVFPRSKECLCLFSTSRHLPVKAPPHRFGGGRAMLFEKAIRCILNYDPPTRPT